MEFSLIGVEKIVVIINSEVKERKIRLKKLRKYMNKNNMNSEERSRYIKMLERFGEI